MAENEPITPEKQLLKLIENPSRQNLNLENAKRQGKKWFSLGTFKGRFGFLKNSFGKKWQSVKQESRRPPGMQQLNFVLKVLLIFLVLYFGYTLATMPIHFKEASNLILHADNQLALPIEQPTELKDLSYYMDKVAARDVFKPGAARKETTIGGQPVEPPQEDMSKKYTLVGIAWSNDPEAMIEDVALKQTSFLKRGQTFSDSVRVVAIFKDKVVLNSKGKEFEIK